MTSPNTGNVTTGPGTLYYAPLGTVEPVTRVATWPAGWVPVGYTAEGHSFSSSLSIDDVEVAELLDPVRRVTTKRDTKVAFAMAEITLAHLKLLLNGGTTAPDSATFADGTTTSASPNLGSLTAAFSSAVDVGKTVTGVAGIPAGTTILSVTSPTAAVMSANATATGTTSITIVSRYGSIFEPPQVGAEVRSMLGWDAEDGLERIIWRRVLQSGNSEIARRKGADYAKFNAEFSLEQPGAGLLPFRWFFETARVAA
jgi:hypothetical protein